MVWFYVEKSRVYCYTAHISDIYLSLGNVADLAAISTLDKAREMVALVGGESNLLQAAREALHVSCKSNLVELSMIYKPYQNVLSLL